MNESQRAEAVSPEGSSGHSVSRARSLAWALSPVMILGGGLLGLGVMTALAVDDPSFALEPNYYQKAVELDAERRQEAQNLELGWQLVLDITPSPTTRGELELLATLSGPDGTLEGATVTAEAFHNARAADVRQLRLEGVGEGRYRVRLADVRPGLWELRFVVERHGVRFTSVQRQTLGPNGKLTPGEKS